MITVVLWDVENPGNLGAIARLCANFNARLALIEPRCNPLDPVARNRAKHAQSVLDESVILSPDTLADFDLVVGTTAQIGTDYNLHRSSILPEKLKELRAHHERVALVFGSESHGLSNAQLARCDVVVHIACEPKYPTLNLSHAAAILLYALLDAREVHEPVGREELRVMYEFIDALVDALEFATDEKRETQRKVWRNVFAKSGMTRREAFAVIGLLKKLIE